MFDSSFDHCFTTEVMQSLGDRFTRDELERIIGSVLASHPTSNRELTRTIECIAWLADSNYEVGFPAPSNLNERIIPYAIINLPVEDLIKVLTTGG